MRIFFLEDDNEFAQPVIRGLRAAGFDVTHFSEPHSFFRQVRDTTPGLVLLDWELPEMTGDVVLTRVREMFGSSVAAIMLTHVETEPNILEALRGGADDYIVKPVSCEMIVARVHAVLRRFQKRATSERVIELGPYRLELATRRATLGAEAIELSAKEFDLFWTLAAEPNRFVPRTELMASVWGIRADVHTNTIAQHIHMIRKKARFAEHGFKLASVYGAGYRLETVGAEKGVRRDEGENASYTAPEVS